MVTLFTTPVVTVALLALLARPSYAYHVYSEFVEQRHIEDKPPLGRLSSTSFDVGNTGCFSLPGFTNETGVLFTKKYFGLKNVANGPCCLHIYFNRCTKDDMQGDEMWEYKHVRLTDKFPHAKYYLYEVANVTADAAFKWTEGKCTNSSRTIDGNKEKAHDEGYYSTTFDPDE